MVEALAKPGDAIVKGMSAENAHLLHMAIGISGEVSELIPAVTKTNDLDNIIEELGDLEFYIQGFCSAVGLDSDAGRARLPVSTPIEAILELATAAGELLDVVKKAAIYNKKLDVVAMNTAMQYVLNAMVCTYIQVNVERTLCIEENIEKLGKRYTEGTYSDKAAQERADKNPSEDFTEEVDEDLDEDSADTVTEDADNLEEMGDIDPEETELSPDEQPEEPDTTDDE